jgi:hypothetical protein
MPRNEIVIAAQVVPQMSVNRPRVRAFRRGEGADMENDFTLHFSPRRYCGPRYGEKYTVSATGRSFQPQRFELQYATRMIKEDVMINLGETAPGFTLQDQFSRKISLDQFEGRRHVMLLFYPLDFTPT